MLKIVYPICCGINVHKKFIVACIASTNDKGVTTYKSSRFSTFTKGLRELSEWLYSNSCTEVCMESTGKYWIPVFNVLEATCKITLAHPKYVKAIRGNLSIKHRRGHKRAIIAIARMMLTAIYQILKKSEPYNAELYKKADEVPKFREVTIQQAVSILESEGYTVVKVINET